ncbi:hypothetical protein J1N35_007112 [Gossypium stocksii]|uniref:Uncharacterized protein n=1 Tax=Gossypium stocksii TaxID=47602 RepID=A0A9D3W5V2_9ROSI|nr:hypothetical protein J1N35_007112 [Gossypium stocksii]
MGSHWILSFAYIKAVQTKAVYTDDAQKSEDRKLRKGKNKAEEDLGSLKTDYKKLRLLMRTGRLGKTLKQWRQEIQEEKTKAEQ